MSDGSLVERLRTDLESGTLVLPTLPEIAVRVQETVADPEAEAADIAAVVRADASLSARLLALANSPFLRARTPITDVKAAINRLGLDYIQYAVAGFAAEQMFQARHTHVDQYLKELWAHSLKVASLSHMLAVEHTKLRGEQAFIAGLLHDIGALPIARYLDDEGGDLMADELLDWITEYHPHAGGLLLDFWGFPEEFVDVGRSHEDLQRESGPRPDLVDVVQVADLQARLGTDQSLADVNLNEIPAFRKLGLAVDIDPAVLAFAASLEDADHEPESHSVPERSAD